ncbi:MAG TPA: 16S rRNA (cytosine(1402)-N(4))-methyltransferase RsmH [Geobacteraceae bacterium]
MEFRHTSVLAEEVLTFLAPRPGGTYVDGTVGGGGHAALVLEASAPDGRLIGFDRDEEALKAAAARLAAFGERVTLIHGNFAGMAQELAVRGINGVDGILCDLGVSSHQLDTGARGFSFQQDAPLDMRMDTSSGSTAADLVNDLPEEELFRIIRDYGEERWAKRIAAFIVRARQTEPLTTTLQLVDVIKGAIPRAKWEERLHPATRTFQALRIAVNGELESVEQGVAAGVKLLNPGGRIVIISFHSLEDRIVKESFREFSRGCICPRELPICVCNHKPKLKVLTSKPVMAAPGEVEANPRARSARLRAAEKMTP